MAKPLLTLLWQTLLTDYVSAIAWLPKGDRLVAASAAGEVVVFDAKAGESTVVQAEQGTSVDGIALSADGQFLAAGGQDGTVRIWKMREEPPMLMTQWEHERVWVDRLRWHPHRPELVVGLGRAAQVWDAAAQREVATLNFATSSVLDVAWHPSGDFLLLAGNQCIQTWRRNNWEDEPLIREIGGASGAIALSADGRYLASGNSDRTLSVWDWQNPRPWQMQGFPGKVQLLAWSRVQPQGSAPVLASASGEGVVLWTKAASDVEGWIPRVLDWHGKAIKAIAFQPQSMLLASGAADGWVCLWNKPTPVTHRDTRPVPQTLEGAVNGVSTLAWSPQGKYLAIGGCGGELLVWATTLSN